MKYCILLFCLCFISYSFSQKKETFIYAIKESDTLRLDIYSPNSIPKDSLLPALLWVHGGGFAVGSRDYIDDAELCKEMAQKGYIAISISYRLLRKNTHTGFGCNCDKKDKIHTFQEAIHDFYDAALFINKHSKEFQINSNHIIAGGSSAGAETVLNAVYLKEYFIQDLDTYSDVRFAGVWSLAGALVDVEYITAQNALPTVLTHGTQDNLVPFGTAAHHYCKPNDPGYLILSGSQTVAQKLQSLDTAYLLQYKKGAGHEMAKIPSGKSLDTVLHFFQETIGNPTIQQITTIIP